MNFPENFGILPGKLFPGKTVLFITFCYIFPTNSDKNSLSEQGKNKGWLFAKPAVMGKNGQILHIYLWRMKFEMKKRILALALAGTTAFSVFGAAMSASALDSTHTEATVDAYVSYKPVAKTIKSVAS